MKYVNVIYKGGLGSDHFLDLTENEVYKGFINCKLLYIEDDSSKNENISHSSLIAHHNCYCISFDDKKFFHIKEL